MSLLIISIDQYYITPIRYHSISIYPVRLFTVFLSFILANSTIAQQINTGFAAIDAYVQTVSYTKDPRKLSFELTKNYTDDLYKTRAIFRWITENIAYNTIIYQKRSRHYSSSRTFEEPDDTSMILKPLNERVAEGVLKRKIAVCDGYARLFKVLCDYAGIRSEIIFGYARTQWNRVGTKFFSNHTWNAVYLNNAWHLLDVTWASGYINFSDDFVKNLNEDYFLSAPQRFIQDHYPESLEWTLLTKPPTLQEFRYSPFRNQAYIKFKIQSYKPAQGIIETAIGDTIRFELEATDPEKKLYLSAHPFIEFGVLPLIHPFYQPEPFSESKGRKLLSQYVVRMPAEWLYVVYNDQIILRYKLNISDKRQQQIIAIN